MSLDFPSQNTFSIDLPRNNHFVKIVSGDPRKSDGDCAELILSKSAGPIKSTHHKPSQLTGFSSCFKDFRISSSQNFSVYFALPFFRKQCPFQSIQSKTLFWLIHNQAQHLRPGWRSLGLWGSSLGLRGSSLGLRPRLWGSLGGLWGSSLGIRGSNFGPLRSLAAHWWLRMTSKLGVSKRKNTMPHVITLGESW